MYHIVPLQLQNSDYFLIYNPAPISSKIFTPFRPSAVPTPTAAAPTARILLYPAASATPPTPMIWMCSKSLCWNISPFMV